MALALRRFRGVKGKLAVKTCMVACAALVLDSCLSSTDPAGRSVIFTDQPSYAAQRVPGTGVYSFTVVATYFNQTRDTVYLETCAPDAPHPQFGVITESGVPADGYDPAWACVGHDGQIAVAAGTSRTDSLKITGPVTWDGRTGAATGSLDGVFRLSYTVLSCRRDNGCPAVSSQARSNTFRVTRSE